MRNLDVAGESATRTLLVLLMVTAGCTGSGADPSADDIGGGAVSVRGEDGDTVDVELDVPGTARWCEGARWLELSAVHGDTGIMIALFPAGSLAAGRYPVGRPVGADSLRTRPAATLGVRWFTPGLVAAFRGWEGVVEVTALDGGGDVGQTVSGTVEANAAALAGAEGSIVVEGAFDRVPVTQADSMCG